jgi:peroxiredoxin
MARLNVLKLPSRVKAPDFSLEDVHGRTYRLEDFRGKVTIVNFWTTW